MQETSHPHGTSVRPVLRRSIAEIRADFPGLSDGEVRLDGAAGTLVPRAVIDAVSDALRASMANLHGEFAASERSGQTTQAARQALADLVGGVPEGVVLGPNMTTLTFHFADAMSADWQPDDEVVVTSLDHDANIRPWVLAAARRGATVRWAEFDPEAGELPVEAFEGLIGQRTRLVALTAASNAIGTRPDVRAITDCAHAAGALTYVRRRSRHAARPDRHGRARRRLLRLFDVQAFRPACRRGDCGSGEAGARKTRQARALAQYRA